jgi:hypothetical protein
VIFPEGGNWTPGRWRSLPMDQEVRAKWWRVPVGEVPSAASHESQVQWLYGWWQRIDAWITEKRRTSARPRPCPRARLRTAWHDGQDE